MEPPRMISIEVPGLSEVVVSRPTNPARLEFAVYCDDTYYSFAGQVVPLGRFLHELGLSVEDCRIELDAWRSRVGAS